MADTKISALPASTTPLAGTEVLPIVQSSATKQVTVANLTAGRAVATAALSATGIVLTTDATDASSTTAASMKTAGGLAVVKKIYVGDNIVPATAAKGINFTANTSLAGMTSQLLNKYEEGTFTPFISFGGGTTGITYFTQSGLYTRVGRVVTVSGSIYIDSKGSSTGVFELKGLPYTSNGYAVVSITYRSGVTYTGQLQAYLNASEARVTISTISAVGAETNLTNTAVAAGTQFYFSCTYHGQ
jgi:hypothetical protein